MTQRTARLIAIAGLMCFSLIVVAALVQPPMWDVPGITASGARVAAYFHAERRRAITSMFIYALGIGLFLCFAAGLWSSLRQIEPGPQPFSAAFAFGAVALFVLIAAALVAVGVLSYRPQEPGIARMLEDTSFGLLALSGMPTAVCLGAYAAVIFRHGSLPRWTAWLAVLGAVSHVFITASFASHGSFLSLESPVIIWVPATFFTWILTTSVALLRTRSDGDEAGRDEPHRITPA
jgi:hypothetical protein